LTIRPSQHEGRIARQLVLLEDCFEGALLAMVAKLDVLDVVRNGIEPPCFRHHLVRGREDELGILVDELLDEPGTGYAVDLDVFTGNPLHLILLFDVVLSDQRSARTRIPPWLGEIT
jgi:hypothetical protein